jgi:hypothetical protein
MGIDRSQNLGLLRTLLIALRANRKPHKREPYTKEPAGMQEIGRMIVVIGVLLVVVGVLLMFSDKIPWIGRLPGDIVVRRKNFTFYFPIVTCILLSILLTMLFRVFFRR